jgi:hypothetical protein
VPLAGQGEAHAPRIRRVEEATGRRAQRFVELLLAEPARLGRPMGLRRCAGRQEGHRARLAPLIVSARLEHSNPMEGMSSIDQPDVEAGFRMSLVLVDCPSSSPGPAGLASTSTSGRRGMIGVTVEIDRGQIIACRVGIEERADARRRIGSTR